MHSNSIRLFKDSDWMLFNSLFTKIPFLGRVTRTLRGHSPLLEPACEETMTQHLRGDTKAQHSSHAFSPLHSCIQSSVRAENSFLLTNAPCYQSVFEVGQRLYMWAVEVFIIIFISLNLLPTCTVWTWSQKISTPLIQNFINLFMANIIWEPRHLLSHYQALCHICTYLYCYLS